MDKDVRKAEEEHKADLLDKELAKFHESLFRGGRFNDNSNWVGKR